METQGLEEVSYLDLFKENESYAYERRRSFIDYIVNRRQILLGLEDEEDGDSSELQDALASPFSFSNIRRWPRITFSTPLSVLHGMNAKSRIWILIVVPIIALIYAVINLSTQVAFQEPGDFLTTFIVYVIYSLVFVGGVVVSLLYLTETGRSFKAALSIREDYGWLISSTKEEYSKSFTALRNMYIFKPVLILIVINTVIIFFTQLLLRTTTINTSSFGFEFQPFGITLTVIGLLIILPLKIMFLTILGATTYVLVRHAFLYFKLISEITERLSLYNSQKRSLIHIETYETIFLLGKSPDERLSILNTIPFWGTLASFFVAISVFLELVGLPIISVVQLFETFEGDSITILLIFASAGLLISIVVPVVGLSLLFSRLFVNAFIFKGKARRELDKLVQTDLVESSLENKYPGEYTRLLFLLRQYISEMNLIPAATLLRLIPVILIQAATVGFTAYRFLSV